MIKLTKIIAVLAAVAVLTVSCNKPTEMIESSAEITSREVSQSSGAGGSESEQQSGSAGPSDSDISFESGSSQASQTSSGGGTSSGSTSGTSTDGKLYIVKNKTVNATIVIAKDALPKVMNAASDLQTHIRKMTGAIVKIGYDDRDRTEGNFILVGRSKVTDSLGIDQPKGYPENETVVLKR
ncbi:MAG: hypothetical protein ACYC5K_11620, partial [Saccharofermentanales bacterium]